MRPNPALYTDAPGVLPRSLSAFADRWIWVLMTGLFMATALAGFIPSSLERLQLMQAGKQQPFPLTTHLHAATMGAWLILSFAQALLVATGKRRWHQTLGYTAVLLGPIIVASLTATSIQFLLTHKDEWPLPQLSDQFAFALFVQGKVIVLFALYLAWAIRVRLRQPQLHKRLVLLASFAVIAAAFSRIPWLPHFGLQWPHYEDLWNALILAPVLLYEALRSPRWLWVWLLGLGLNLPFMAAYYYLGLGAPIWWQELVAGLIGRAS